MVIALCLSLGLCVTSIWDFDTWFSLSIVVKMTQTLSVKWAPNLKVEWHCFKCQLLQQRITCGDRNLSSQPASRCRGMQGESPCAGKLIGEIWVTVTASARRQAVKWSMRWAQRRWIDDLLFIDAPRGSETGSPGRAPLQLALEMIPCQSCKRNTVWSWHSLGVPWLCEHVDVPQEQLLVWEPEIQLGLAVQTLLRFICLFFGECVLVLWRKNGPMLCILPSKSSLLSLFDGIIQS